MIYTHKVTQIRELHIKQILAAVQPLENGTVTEAEI
jgi:hypothetical protein